MSKTLEAKLDVLDAMNKALGKLTNVQIRLTLAGEKDLAKELETKRKALLGQIETLQKRVADKWAVNASALTEKLRVANGDVQARILNIKKKIKVAENAAQIIGRVDKALAFLKTVAP